MTQGSIPVVDAFERSVHTVAGVIEPEPRTPLSLAARWVRSLSGDSGRLAQYCRRHRIPYIYLRRDDTRLAAWLAARRPDLLAVYSVPLLLREEVYALPRHGSVNLHLSLLPRYRGPNPLFWTYHDFDLDGGLTVHAIDAGEDTGPIMAQHRSRIPLGASVEEVIEQAVRVGAAALCRVADQIGDGTAEPRVQPHESPTARARNVTRDEVRYLIDWENLTLEHTYHLLRGYLREFDLLPALPRRPLEYWAATGYDSQSAQAPPGVIYAEGGRTYLACSGGRVELERRRSRLRQRFRTNAATIATPRPR